MRDFLWFGCVVACLSVGSGSAGPTSEQTSAPSRGASDARVVLVEYSDFECPYCRAFARTLDRVFRSFGDSVRIEFRQFPLRRIHEHAQKAAEASLCAHDQGAFWRMHDLMFAEPDRLDIQDLKDKASRLALDRGRFDQCLDDGQKAHAVDADRAGGIAQGVNGTPTLFLNGVLLARDAVSYDSVATALRNALAGGIPASGSRLSGADSRIAEDEAAARTRRIHPSSTSSFRPRTP